METKVRRFSSKYTVTGMRPGIGGYFLNTLWDGEPTNRPIGQRKFFKNAKGEISPEPILVCGLSEKTRRTFVSLDDGTVFYPLVNTTAKEILERYQDATQWVPTPRLDKDEEVLF